MATPTKNWKEGLELLGVLLGATAFNLVTSVPRTLGFARRTFVIDGRTVVRPDAYSDRPQKRAFEEVAMFLVQSGRDDLARFRDDEILRNFHGDRDRAPLEVWHEVLVWFAAQGHLTAGWALLFRYSPGTHVIVPSWDRDGNKGSGGTGPPGSMGSARRSGPGSSPMRNATRWSALPTPRWSAPL